jgi:hypothetical protein
MNISNNSLWPFDLSASSGGRSINVRVNNWVGAAFLAGLLLFGGSAKAAFTPYNVLVNPGAETGDLTGWNFSSPGFFLVVSTNGIVHGTTSEHYLAHSGQYAFQLAGDISYYGAPDYFYQDFAATAGSQWSASSWAICYASNYFNDGAIAYMSVAFYDKNNHVLGASFDPGFSTYGYGVYGSVILDPNAPGFGVDWIIAPPPAVDATGWVYLSATNFYYGYTPANTNNAPGQNIESSAPPSLVTTNLVAPPGTAYVRYQLEYDNSTPYAGAVYWDDCVLEKLNQSDPDIVNPLPSNVTCYVGDPAAFTVVATKAQKSEVLTYQWSKNGTNLPTIPGGDIFGYSTNATLQFTDCQYSDAGSYACWVSDTNGSIRSVPVNLTVLTPPGTTNITWQGTVSVITTNSITYAKYTWGFGGCEEVVNIGPVIYNGSNFLYDFDLEMLTGVLCPEFVGIINTTATLGTLAPGTYTLTTTSWGVPVAINTFTIPDPTPILQPVGFGTNGSFQIQLSNTVNNASYVLQCSTNLMDWTSLSTNSGAPSSLSDPSPVWPGPCFYRVQILQQ